MVQLLQFFRQQLSQNYCFQVKKHLIEWFLSPHTHVGKPALKSVLLNIPEKGGSSDPRLHQQYCLPRARLPLTAESIAVSLRKELGNRTVLMCCSAPLPPSWSCCMKTWSCSQFLGDWTAGFSICLQRDTNSNPFLS